MLFAREVRVARRNTINEVELGSIRATGICYLCVHCIVIVEPPLDA